MNEKIHLFDLAFCNTDLEGAVHMLRQQVDSGNQAKVVATPNTNHIVHIERNPDLKKMYQGADYLFADGFPLISFSKIVHRPLKERITGADLMPLLMKDFKGKISIVGGFPGEEKYIQNTLLKKYPSSSFSVFCPAANFDPKGEEAKQLVTKINEIKSDIVFVCIGMPKQEIWAMEMRDSLHTKLILCVGAALDFALDRKKRAPKWVQTINLEWLWRLCSDPKRLWKRYLVENLSFIKIAIKEYWHQKK